MAFIRKTWVNVPDINKLPSIPEGQDALARFDADNMNRIELGIDEHIKDASVHNNATDGGGAIGEGATEVGGGGSIGKNATTTSGAAIGKNAKSTFGAAIGDGASSQGGGGAVGYHASVDSGGGVGREASATSGGAIGYNAKTLIGAAVGSLSSSDSGGAAGQKASAVDGGAVGSNAKTGDGAAVGRDAKSQKGGAIGYAAEANHGAAVGSNAKTGDGVALGNNAKTTMADGTLIDAIQLGEGTNKVKKTLQAYNYLLMNADGIIPVERMASKVAKLQTHTYDGGGKGNPVTLTFEFVPKIVFVQCVETGVTHTMTFMINGARQAGSFPQNSQTQTIDVTWSNKTVTFTTSGTNLNTSGQTYSCVALG